MATSRREVLGLGVISFAHGHVNAYIETIADFPDARVVAAWDSDTTRGEAQCAKYHLEFERDLEALLGRDDIDAVFVTSPTNEHAEHVTAAARAGKGVLLQKPMALTLEDCDRISAAIGRHGVPFSMCYQMRCDPVNLKIKELLEQGAVGKVAVVRRRHAIGALLQPSFARPDNWHVDPVRNMGMFMDDASHAADWFYWLLGRPVSVIAEIANVVTTVAPDDNGAAIYRFGRGEMGLLLNSSTQLAAEATTEIYGDRGTIIQNYGDAPSSILPRPADSAALKIFREGAADWEVFDFPNHTPQGARIRAVPRQVVDFLHGRRGPIATVADGRVCIEMILGAYEAARSGRRVGLMPTERAG
jgi:predicted dehydrogenase